MYDKHDWYQRDHVRAGCAALTAYTLSPSGPHSNAAGSRSRLRGAASGSRRAGRGRVRVPHTHVCTVRARRLWRALPRCVPYACSTG